MNMIMIEEIKTLIDDILKLECKRDEILQRRDLAFCDSTIERYECQQEELEKIINRRMEILRIISKD